MKKLSFMLVLASIVALPGTFSIAALIGQPEIYGLGGLLRYVWIMWLAIPIGAATVLVGLKLKANGTSYKGVIGVGIASIAFLLLFGSYGIFPDSAYDSEALQPVADVTGVAFPKNTKAALSVYGDYTLCKGMISVPERADFVQQVRGSENWTTKLDPVIKRLMPTMVIPELESSLQASYDVFLFRNLESGDYNTLPEKYKETPCVLIAYDYESGRFMIVKDYTINFA